MSGSVYNRARWIITKRQIFEGRLGIGAGWVYCAQKRTTWCEFIRAHRKRLGPYWRYRKTALLRRINFYRRRYGE